LKLVLLKSHPRGLSQQTEAIALLLANLGTLTFQESSGQPLELANEAAVQQVVFDLVHALIKAAKLDHELHLLPQYHMGGVFPDLVLLLVGRDGYPILFIEAKSPKANTSEPPFLSDQRIMGQKDKRLC